MHRVALTSMDTGVWVSIIGIAIGAIIGIVGLIAGWIYFRKGRQQAADARKLAEESARTSRNLAQSHDRNLGFDYLTLWVDLMQYGMCRNNTGHSKDKLSKDELRSLRDHMIRYENTGIALLENTLLDDHAESIVAPAYRYIINVFLENDNPFGPGPSVERYEAARIWLVEARRVCNEIAESGSAERAAEEVERKVYAAQEELNSRLSQKLYDPNLKVAIFTGDAVPDMLNRDLARLGEFEDHLEVCRSRLRVWKERGMLSELRISDDFSLQEDEEDSA